MWSQWKHQYIYNVTIQPKGYIEKKLQSKISKSKIGEQQGGHSPIGY